MKTKAIFKIGLKSVTKEEYAYIRKLIGSHLIMALRRGTYLIIYVRPMENFYTLECVQFYKDILKRYKPEISFEMGDYPE